MHSSSRSMSSKSARVPSIVSSGSSQSESVSWPNATSPRVPVQVFEGHEEWALCACFYPDENKIVSGSRDKTLRIWDRKTGAVEVLRGHTASVEDVDVSRDGKLVVSGSLDKTVRIWNAESGEMMHVLGGHKGRVSWVGFSPDSGWVVSASNDSTLRVQSVVTGKLAFEPIKCHGSVDVCVCYSPSGDRILSGTGLCVQIWDAQTGIGILSIRKSSATSLAWTLDGTQIIGGWQSEVTIWDSRNGEPLHIWQASNTFIRELSLSPNGTHLATGGQSEGVAFVLDITTGKEVAVLWHDENMVYGITYSPSARFIVTSCLDKKVYLWEAPALENPQHKSPKPSFTSFLNRPAIPLAGPSRNNGSGAGRFRDVPPHAATDRGLRGPSLPQWVLNKVSNFFSRRPAGPTHHGPVVKLVEIAAGKDKPYAATIDPPQFNRMQKILYTIIHCRKPDEEEEKTPAAKPDVTVDSSQLPAGKTVIDTQPQRNGMVAGPSSGTPQTSKVLAHASPQPTPLMDSSSSAVAQTPSFPPTSSTAPVTSMPIFTLSNSSHLTITQPSSLPMGLQPVNTFSPEEVALIEEYRRLKETSAGRMVADLLSGAAREHSSHEPSSPLLLSPGSVTPSTSSTPFPSSPQAHLATYSGPSPLPIITPASPLLLPSPQLHHQLPTMANVQSLDPTASADDTVTEAPLLSDTQPAAHQHTTTEDDEWAFYEEMHQVESSIHLYA